MLLLASVNPEDLDATIKRLALVSILFALVGILIIAGVSFSCSPRGYSGEPGSITIGVPPNEQSGLIFIAEDQGFFEKNGLKATIKRYLSFSKSSPDHRDYRHIISFSQ